MGAYLGRKYTGKIAARKAFQAQEELADHADVLTGQVAPWGDWPLLNEAEFGVETAQLHVWLQRGGIPCFTPICASGGSLQTLDNGSTAASLRFIPVLLAAYWCLYT